MPLQRLRLAMPFAARAAPAVLALPIQRAVAARPVAVVLRLRQLAVAQLQTQDAVLQLNNAKNPQAARQQLILLSAAMAREGATTLIERVLPSPPQSYRQWTHYPKGDAIDPISKSRWFYHAHPPQQRDPGEHGHFHIFLPLAAFDGLEPLAKPEKEKPAKVVHVASLSFNTDGLPTHWAATNQWVTEEYLYAAELIIERLDQLQLQEAGIAKDIPQVGEWLTLALQMCQEDIISLLRERDEALARSSGPRDKEAEILARRPFAL